MLIHIVVEGILVVLFKDVGSCCLRFVTLGRITIAPLFAERTGNGLSGELAFDAAQNI